VLWIGVRQEEIIEAYEQQFASTVEVSNGFFLPARLLRTFRSKPIRFACGLVQFKQSLGRQFGLLAVARTFGFPHPSASDFDSGSPIRYRSELEPNHPGVHTSLFEGRYNLNFVYAR
jgi:hypothetical protein